MAIRVLLLEDSDEAADALMTALKAHESASTFQIVRVAKLTQALQELRRKMPDAALIDLGLPDSQGLRAPRALNAAAPDLPIVVWTGHNSQTDALALIQAGIQDYLIKGEASVRLVYQSVLFAIKRKQRERQFRRMAAGADRSQVPNGTGTL
jgi:DNA-binding NarL/FixJ family response regulator